MKPAVAFHTVCCHVAPEQYVLGVISKLHVLKHRQEKSPGFTFLAANRPWKDPFGDCCQKAQGRLT